MTGGAGAGEWRLGPWGRGGPSGLSAESTLIAFAAPH